MELKLMLLVLMSTASAVEFDLKDGVIVQLFEWKWTDIEKECKDFLGPKKFAAVQISPPNENLVIKMDNNLRSWRERYHPVSYNLKTRSGTSEELQNMIKECNDHGVRVLVEAVLNNMSGETPEDSKGTDGSKADYVNHVYGEIFKKEHFHPFCEIKEKDSIKNVRNCELDGKRDLDQSNSDVRDAQVKYLNGLIEMGVAGFSIPSATNMWPNELKEIFLKLNDLNAKHGFIPGTRPLIYQEVMEYELCSKDDKTCEKKGITWSEYSHLGKVYDYRYAEAMSQTFQGLDDFDWFKNFALLKQFYPKDSSIVFIDNHETQRRKEENKFLHYKNFVPYKMAVAFMLAYPWGTPKIFSGYKFDDEHYNDNIEQGPPKDEKNNILSPIINNACNNGWMCEHRWRQIYNMVEFHKVVAGTDVEFQWQTKTQVAFCRGEKGFIAFNTDKKEDLKEKIKTCLPKGSYCDVISGQVVGNKCEGPKSKIVEVDEKGMALIDISKIVTPTGDTETDGVLAIHIGARIEVIS